MSRTDATEHRSTPDGPAHHHQVRGRTISQENHDRRARHVPTTRAYDELTPGEIAEIRRRIAYSDAHPETSTRRRRALSLVHVIPDTHGCLPELREALSGIDLTDPTTTLILLGDYIDRGPDSLGVLTAVKHLTDHHPDQVVALAGNHECWFLDWIDADDADPTWLLADTELATTRSLLPADVVEAAVADLVDAARRGSADPDLAGRANARIKNEVTARHLEIIEWLRRRPLTHETGTHLFVHAGVDEDAGPSWEAMTPERMLTEKYPPSLGAHRVGETIVAGHVGVGPLHAAQGRLKCWEPYTDAGHIYLDGRVEVTGQLNTMHYDTGTGATTFHTATA